MAERSGSSAGDYYSDVSIDSEGEGTNGPSLVVGIPGAGESRATARRRRACARRWGKRATSCLCCVPRCLGRCACAALGQVIGVLLFIGVLVGLLIWALVRTNTVATDAVQSAMQSYVARFSGLYENVTASFLAGDALVLPYRCALWSGGALPSNAWAISSTTPLMYGTLVLRGLSTLHLNVSVAGINFSQLRAIGLVAPALSAAPAPALAVGLGNLTPPVAPPALGNALVLALAFNCQDFGISGACALVDASRVSARPVYVVLFSHATALDAAHALLQAPLTQCVQ